jgi:hypothetical protein
MRYLQIFRPSYRTPGLSNVKYCDQLSGTVSMWMKSSESSPTYTHPWKPADVAKLKADYESGRISPFKRRYIVIETDTPLHISQLQDLHPEYFI